MWTMTKPSEPSAASEPVDWQAVIDDRRGVCPHCWGPHSDAWYTCQFVSGYYTCGACAQRYTMPEFPTKAQVEALEDECRRNGASHLKDFTDDDLRGMWGAILRQEVRASGWTWPDV